jgi:hypothetical protein
VATARVRSPPASHRMLLLAALGSRRGLWVTHPRLDEATLDPAVPSSDLLAITSIIVLLATAAVIACWLPAGRGRVDPRGGLAC